MKFVDTEYYNEWVDYFAEGYDIYSINNFVNTEIKCENYFSFKDDEKEKNSQNLQIFPTESKKEENVLKIENINNLNIMDNIKEEIEVIDTEEEEKNVIYNNNNGYEVKYFDNDIYSKCNDIAEKNNIFSFDKKKKIQEEIKNLNEKLKKYKEKSHIESKIDYISMNDNSTHDEPKVATVNTKKKNKTNSSKNSYYLPSDSKQANSYSYQIKKSKKTNFINLEMIKEKTYGKIHQGKSNIKLSSITHIPYTNSLKRLTPPQSQINISKTKITNYNIVHQINLNDYSSFESLNDSLKDVERRLKDYSEMNNDSTESAPLFQFQNYGKIKENENNDIGNDNMMMSDMQTIIERYKKSTMNKSNSEKKEKNVNLLIKENKVVPINRLNIQAITMGENSDIFSYNQINNFPNNSVNNKEIKNETFIDNDIGNTENDKDDKINENKNEKNIVETQKVINNQQIENKKIVEQKLENKNNNNKTKQPLIPKHSKKRSVSVNKSSSPKTENKNNDNTNNIKEDAIPFHLIDKTKIYKNLVKYMYGKVPKSKSLHKSKKDF